MITDGMPIEWIAWVLFLLCTLIPAACCYRAGKRVGAPDGETLDAFYGVLMVLFLIAAFLVFLHAPFHVWINAN